MQDFKIDKNIAYFFGFFWGDGGMKSNDKITTPKICIVKEDAEKLMDTFSSLEYAYKDYCQENRKERRTFVFKSKIIKEILIKLNAFNKSSAAPDKVLNLIPKNLHLYFWRGYIDADGCFYKRKNKKGGTFSISSSLNQDWSSVEKWFKSIDVENYNIYRKETSFGNSSVIEVKYGPDIKKIGDFLYKKYDEIGLGRKYLKYIEIIKSLEILTSKTKGVSFCKKQKKWRAYFNKQHLGWFLSEEEAIQSRIKAQDQIIAS
jgi:hypothetical protein